MMIRDLLLRIFAERLCAACDAPLSVRDASRATFPFFCPPCAASIVAIPRGPEGDDGAVCVGSYGGALATSIRKLKYNDRTDLALPLSELLIGAVDRVGLGMGASEDSALRLTVVPVPLHPRRLRQRGYNQSALLARPLAKHLDATFRADWLIRAVDTEAQAGRDRPGRIRQLAHAFKLAPHSLPQVANSCVLLVDDVMTTGATLDACEFALKSGGCSSIVRAVIARAEG